MSTIQGRLHSPKDKSEEGFTLVELLVVLLIIGILLAVAIPTFLTATKAANSTTAQANLQTALTGANAYYALDAGVAASDCVAKGTAPTAGTLTGPQTGGFPSA